MGERKSKATQEFKPLADGQQTYKKKYRQTDRATNKQKERHTKRQKDRQTKRQINVAL